MTRYAQGTSVPVEKSRAEIENTLTKYGASQFGYATDQERGIATVQFACNGRHIRFLLRFPSISEDQFKWTPAKKKIRSPESQREAWEQACRQRWRALALCIKAKLEAVECKISEFEDEFLAHTVLPDGETVGQLMRPQIEHAYQTGAMPPGIAGLLPEPQTERHG